MELASNARGPVSHIIRLFKRRASTRDVCGSLPSLVYGRTTSPCRSKWVRPGIYVPCGDGQAHETVISNGLVNQQCKRYTLSNFHCRGGYGYLLNRKHISNELHVNSFHTSSSRKAIPIVGPILIKLASPLSRLGAVLLGRQLRKWWRNLPENHRIKLFNDARRRGDKILIAIFGTLAICFGYYSYHLEENSLTGRKQLMIMNENQMREIAEREFTSLKNDMEGLFLPSNHPNHIRVYKVARRILQYNSMPEIVKRSWKVNVVDSEIVNAFVLPNGEIFVMNGMLKTVANDDELAGILGHEMAHAILNHPAEQLSFSGFASIFNLIILTVLWTVVPTDGLAILFNWIESMLQDILIHLPYQRDLEKEADCVGLYLAARACFDVRKISNFWERMDKLEEDKEKAEWLSTHPSHSKRAEWINDWMPQALEMRKANNCPDIAPFYGRVRHILGL